MLSSDCCYKQRADGCLEPLLPGLLVSWVSCFQCRHGRQGLSRETQRSSQVVGVGDDDWAQASQCWPACDSRAKPVPHLLGRAFLRPTSVSLLCHSHSALCLEEDREKKTLDLQSNLVLNPNSIMLYHVGKVNSFLGASVSSSVKVANHLCFVLL
jgi:hypothetical protein